MSQAHLRKHPVHAAQIREHFEQKAIARRSQRARYGCDEGMVLASVFVEPHRLAKGLPLIKPTVMRPPSDRSEARHQIEEGIEELIEEMIEAQPVATVKVVKQPIVDRIADYCVEALSDLDEEALHELLDMTYEVTDELPLAEEGQPKLADREAQQIDDTHTTVTDLWLRVYDRKG